MELLLAVKTTPESCATLGSATAVTAATKAACACRAGSTRSGAPTRFEYGDMGFVDGAYNTPGGVELG
jgi:hypothetical protein